MELTRVAVLGGYPALRAGLRAMVAEFPGFMLVDEPGCADVVLAVGRAGVEAAGAVPVVALASDGPEAREVAAGPGPPVSVLFADAEPEQLESALRAAAAGLLAFAPGAYRTAGGQQATADLSPADERLTARESEVLELIADGLPNKAIALRLGISENTVKFHVASVLGKLGTSSRAEAVMAAARRGWLIV